MPYITKNGAYSVIDKTSTTLSIVLFHSLIDILHHTLFFVMYGSLNTRKSQGIGLQQPTSMSPYILVILLAY